MMGRILRACAAAAGLLLLGSPPAFAASCPNACDDGNLCTDDICDPAVGCIHFDNSAGCSDGNACTAGDVCHAGVCVGGDVAPGCTSCDAVAELPADGGLFFGTVSGVGSLTGSCAASSASAERVFRWTAPSSGTATISSCGGETKFDTAVYLRAQACNGPELACNDQAPCAIAGSPGDGSRITPSVTAGETYFIVVDGVGGATGRFQLRVEPASACGNDIREGQEACDGLDAAACPSGACTPGCVCEAPAGGLPDLHPEITDWFLDPSTNVAEGDVAEGCAEATGNVDLLRFGVNMRNDGSKNFEIGSPSCPSPCTAHPLEICNNPQFICSPAEGHNHAHYNNYARYELLDTSTQAVVIGHKQGFCLEDSGGTCPNPSYTCGYQGITAGCADHYGSLLGCQYLDITGVPAGNYTLRVTVDPFHKIDELDESNNVAEIPITLAATACSSETAIPPQGGAFAGTTSGESTLTGGCGGLSEAPEQVFAFTPSASGTAVFETCGAGTDFDTVLYVKAGTCEHGTTLGCSLDACTIADGSNQGSRITMNVSAGQTYHVVVDGYGTKSGNFVLTVTPPPGTPPSDADADGVADLSDNCPAAANPDQADQDADGVGDACDHACAKLGAVTAIADLQPDAAGAGSPIAVHATGIGASPQLWFGATAAEISLQMPDRLIAFVPSLPVGTTVGVTLVNPEGCLSEPVNFTLSDAAPLSRCGLLGLEALCVIPLAQLLRRRRERDSARADCHHHGRATR